MSSTRVSKTAPTTDQFRPITKAAAEELLRAAGASVICAQDDRRFVRVEALCSQLGLEVVRDSAMRSRAELRRLPTLACVEMFEARVNVDLTPDQRRFPWPMKSVTGVSRQVDSRLHRSWKRERATTLPCTSSCLMPCLMSGYIAFGRWAL